MRAVQKIWELYLTAIQLMSPVMLEKKRTAKARTGTDCGKLDRMRQHVSELSTSPHLSYIPVVEVRPRGQSIARRK